MNFAKKVIKCSASLSHFISSPNSYIELKNISTHVKSQSTRFVSLSFACITSMLIYMGLNATKLVFRVSDKVRLKPVSTATKSDTILEN